MATASASDSRRTKRRGKRLTPVRPTVAGISSDRTDSLEGVAPHLDVGDKALGLSRGGRRGVSLPSANSAIVQAEATHADLDQLEKALDDDVAAGRVLELQAAEHLGQGLLRRRVERLELGEQGKCRDRTRRVSLCRPASPDSAKPTYLFRSSPTSWNPLALAQTRETPSQTSGLRLLSPSAAMLRQAPSTSGSSTASGEKACAIRSQHAARCRSAEKDLKSCGRRRVIV